MYRWKQPYTGQQDLTQATDAYNTARGSIGMAGYANPSQQMQGYVPNTVGVPVPHMPYSQGPAEGYGESYSSAVNADVLNEIAQLETQLNAIDAQIAALDKQYPGIASNDFEIAAKRAEVGDFSAYDNMVNRGQTAVGNATSNERSIENELFNAEKLTWGLSSKSDEDRAMARNQIEVALRKAEKEAERTNTRLPDSYYRLKAALDKSGEYGTPEQVSERIAANDMWTKAKSGTLTDTDIAEMKTFIKNNPNSDTATALRPIVEQYEGKTVEKRAAAKRERDAADNLFKAMQNMSKEGMENYWNGLTKKQKEVFKKYHKIDLVEGRVE